jgi:DNA-directed RNA polymerase specialized sigma24 family protein
VLGIPDEAEDVTQDVFLKLWDKRNQAGSIKSIEAFAITVTKNICLDKLKSKKVNVVELARIRLSRCISAVQPSCRRL